MLPGFNHNLRHRDVVFHVQTEDGGFEDPILVTQLFVRGQILSVERWSYAHRIREAETTPDALATVIRDRMVAMHKAMLRAVTRGQFDAAFAPPAGPEPAERDSRLKDSAPATSPPGESGLRSSSAGRSAPLGSVGIGSSPLESVSPSPPERSRASPGSRVTDPRRSQADTVEASVDALELRSPDRAPTSRRPSTGNSAFDTSALSDEELLAEIDAELRRSERARAPTAQPSRLAAPPRSKPAPGSSSGSIPAEPTRPAPRSKPAAPPGPPPKSSPSVPLGLGAPVKPPRSDAAAPLRPRSAGQRRSGPAEVPLGHPLTGPAGRARSADAAAPAGYPPPAPRAHPFSSPGPRSNPLGGPRSSPAAKPRSSPAGVPRSSPKKPRTDSEGSPERSRSQPVEMRTLEDEILDYLSSD